MHDEVMNLPILNLAIAYVFVLLLLVIFKVRGIRRERQIIIATTRMTIQLIIMGVVLVFVLKNPHWYVSLLILAVMLSFAIYNAKKRIPYYMPKKLQRLMTISMIFGYLFTSVVFLFLVLRVKPWFDPQYFIPISGMIIGNSMTGIALGGNKLCSAMIEQREKIQNSIMLGATPKDATYDIVNEAFDGAMMPTMNNMLTMGLVSIPGMMTGQILSGTFPLTAIKYQIGIMLAILGCTALTLVIFVTLGYQTFFNDDMVLAQNS